jgi:hypothetical protein
VRVAKPRKPKDQRRCRVCESHEERIIVRVLAAGVSPRAIAKRFSSVTRKDIIQYARGCVVGKNKGD